MHTGADFTAKTGTREVVWSIEMIIIPFSIPLCPIENADIRRAMT